MQQERRSEKIQQMKNRSSVIPLFLLFVLGINSQSAFARNRVAKQKHLALKSIVASSTQRGDVATLFSGGFWKGKGQTETGSKTDEIQIEFLDMSLIAGVVLKTCSKNGIQSGIQLFVRTANANENPVGFPFQGSDKNGILHYGTNRKNDFPDVLSLTIRFPKIDSLPVHDTNDKKLIPCLEKLTFLTGDRDVPEYTVQRKSKNALIETQKNPVGRMER